MADILYNLFIMPIELLVEITYSVMYRMLNNYGLAIIAVSLVVQTLILPLYKRSDAIQNEERQRQKNMSHWVKHIRKTFKGDEQFMMLSTYYRQQGYKSWYALKSSASILLQIPFFIAAYHFLSTTNTLKGESFLAIKDLGSPDQALAIGGLAINILPIIMTLFNIISGIIYTKGLEKRDKFQVYGLAVIFLILLYNSPAGLVLYWTMNNLYSLMKNVCMKLFAGGFKIIKIGYKRHKKSTNATYKNSKKNAGGGVYAIEALFLTVFMGGIIPLNVLNDSPAEFIIETYGPIDIILENLTIYGGIFLVWGMILFIFMSQRVRYYLTVIVFVFIGIFILDHMGFGHNLGNMSALLVYDEGISYSMLENVINMCMVCIVGVIFLFISIKYSNVMKKVLQILAFSAVIMFIINFIKLKNQTDDIMARTENNENIEKNQNQDDEMQGEEKILTLSRTGKNVIVFMLDRAINGYIPFIFDEKPELKMAFDGFTYYPNTLSFGKYTNFGVPALFGGYEYTPSEMNKRKSEKLADKHDEALLVLPCLFSDEGYSVTVCDPPYAGSYDYTPDLSIYDKYEDVKAYVLSGKYTDYSAQEYNTLV